ncbi:MAG: metal ABC transporter permease, partial [Gemmatimonadales bacterium]
IALGLRYLGVLLMGSLLIIPAAAAKHLAGSLNAMQAISVAIAVGATVLGSIAAPLLHIETGPATILIAALAFLVSLPLRPAE